MSAVKIGGMMLASYLLVTVNYWMVARGSYVGSVGSDVLILLLNWTLFRRIVQSDRVRDRIGYTVGGALGSLLGLYLTGAR